jgi:hypothetical protein
MPRPDEQPGVEIQGPMVAPGGPETAVIDDIEEELWTDDSGEDYAGWYCVRTDPWNCPAEGCTFVARFLTASHLIIVWPEIDDPSLLRHAAAARDIGRNPKVDVYEPAFGPACSYYQWEAAGHPVHAVRKDIGEDIYKAR